MLVARNSRATGAEDAGSTQFAGVVKQNAGVVVEADVRPIGATDFIFFVRTTTAFDTVPFFTSDEGITLFTDTTIMSPTDA